MRPALIEKHPLWIRWAHWVNFPLLGIMIWSGWLIYWANSVYSPFFPDGFYRALHIPYRLAEGLALHFSFMWAFAINGFLYAGYLAASGEWRSLAPGKGGLRDAWRVLLHDLHLRKELPPQGKYNAAQRLSYTAIVVMGLLSVLTGLAIYKPVQLHWLESAFGGYENARYLHFLLMLGYLGFFLIHVIQVARAGWNNFRSMVAGVEVKEVKELNDD